MSFEVMVGNIGSVYYGFDKREAWKHYREYVAQSKSSVGRAAGESVTILSGGEIVREFIGSLHRKAMDF